MAAAIFSFSLHPLAKKISAKKLCDRAQSSSGTGAADDSHSIASAGCHRSDRGDNI
jgi:hypothetical protein